MPGRAEPCHARRDISTCEHGVRLVCFACHERTDRILDVLDRMRSLVDAALRGRETAATPGLSPA
jgi:hypothetical protein